MMMKYLEQRPSSIRFRGITILCQASYSKIEFLFPTIVCTFKILIHDVEGKFYIPIGLTLYFSKATLILFQEDSKPWYTIRYTYPDKVNTAVVNAFDFESFIKA